MYTVEIETLQGNFTLLVFAVDDEVAQKAAKDFLIDRNFIKSEGCSYISARALAPNMEYKLPISAIESLIQYGVAILDRK